MSSSDNLDSVDPRSVPGTIRETPRTVNDKHREPASDQLAQGTVHRWAVCPLCGPMVICGSCGNNCCNGGSGDGCPDVCAAAYEMQKQGKP